MKRNFLFIVAVCFVLTVFCAIITTHVFDERKKQPVFAPQKIERVLPKLPKKLG